jgi:hypothetical protein
MGSHRRSRLREPGNSIRRGARHPNQAPLPCCRHHVGPITARAEPSPWLPNPSMGPVRIGSSPIGSGWRRRSRPACSGQPGSEQVESTHASNGS